MNMRKEFKMATPDMSHATGDDWDVVYEPAEDTFLLLDALEKDMEFALSRCPRVCLEVGSGSGVVITAISKVFSSTVHCLAVDVTSHACALTKRTSCHNGVEVEVVQGDLMHCLRDQAVDMVVFNPPYVVTPSQELKISGCLAKSWAGGERGREVIDRFLACLDRVLDPRNGFGYLLVLKENDPEDVMQILSRIGFQCEIVAYRKLKGEELSVIRFWKRLVSDCDG